MDRISRALELAKEQREQQATRHPSEPADVSGFLGRPAAETLPDEADIPCVTVDREHLRNALVQPSGTGGPLAAPYKLLRTQVLHRLDQLGANTLAILSSSSGAGKTLTSLNLAISIAAELSRTALLVDLDLRNPNIHVRLGIQPRVGVEHCLRGEARVEDAMLRLEGYDRLAVLPATGPVGNSSELLTSTRAAALIQQLRMRDPNRIVIFDLPPVLQADDALAFSRHVQAGLVVVRERSTERGQLVRSIEMMSELKLIGTVLNGSYERSVTHYHY